MNAEFGKIYTFTVHGEPVPKSTMKPPRHKAAYHIVQKDQKYKPLKNTWAYQRDVANAAVLGDVPHFDKDDPIGLSLHIFKSGRKTGDTKNILASIEDGLQFGMFIPNDRKVAGYGKVDTDYGVGKANARVEVTVQIYWQVSDIKWLTDYFGSKKKAQEYWDRVVKR